MLELPTDRPRPPVQTSHGAHLPFSLSPALSTALVALSRREGITLFMTFLAAFQALLSRYSGQDDIVVGSPIANRTRREIEGLIGFFVNTLVLRADLGGNPPFRDLLKQVRTLCLHAYAHQDLPFERLVEELHLERDPSRHPLFQVMFALQNAPLQALSLPGLTLHPLPIATQTAKFDLTLSLTETAAGLVGAWEYNTDLFECATIRRMAEHFTMLLEGIVADPERRLAELPLLTEAERQTLVTWNASAVAYPQGACIHELVAAQAARTPDAVAVVFDRGQGSGVRGQGTAAQTPLPPPAGGGTEGGAETRRHGDKESSLNAETQHPTPNTQHLTYGELNMRANRLAHHLCALGVGPEVRVGICLERSPDLLVGLLGILSAGGAYVPLDPAYPPARLAFMLADAQVAVLLTLQHIYDLRFTIYDLEESASAIVNRKSKIVNLDADWPAIAAEPPHNPACRVRPENLAYVIYTSGSTGRPKGVGVPHRALLNHAYAVTQQWLLDTADRVLQFASINFDVAAEEVFPAWLNGATVVLLPGQQALSFVEFGYFVERERLTVLNLPAAYWHEWVAALAQSTSYVSSALRLMIVGSEKVIPERVAMWRSLVGERVRLSNAYGPTETTITTTIYETAPDLDYRGRAALPIGRPIANAQTYVLDRHLRPVPIGAPGDLYVGGVGLARGYLRHADRTAAAFIPHPLSSAPGARLYMTGDRARYLLDGIIEFLGRADRQVKVRGFRIELGEIEGMLAQHPSIRECAVLAREDLPGDTRLVAYLVTSDKLQVTSSADSSLVTRHSLLVTQLRDFLKEKLPEYMVPAAFVTLDVLPLTPNGKLDRRALPPPDAAVVRSDALHVAPRDVLELQLAQIWEDVLALQPIGITDNFFALGGHPLLAVRLLAQIERVFGRRLPLAALFQDPTITQLAQRLRQQGDTTPWSPLVALQPRGTRRPFFCVHPVSGSVLCYLELARALGADQPFYGLQAAGLEGEQPPLNEVSAMATSYVAALRVVQPQGPYQLGGWSLGGVIALEMARQLRAQGQEVALLALLDTLAPLPGQWRAPAEQQDASLLAGFLQDLAARAGQTLDLSTTAIAPYAPEQAMRSVVAQAQAHGVLSPDISVAQIEERFAVFKANLTAVGRYVSLDTPCPIVLFRVSDSAAARAIDPQLGWGTLAAGALEVVEVAGDHYTMVAQPHVQQLAQRLRVYLAG